jgi:hypothetical protein
VNTEAVAEGRLRGRPVTVSTQGLHLLLDALIEPVDVARVPSALADDVAVLIGSGLLASDGSVPEAARAGVSAVRQPLCVIDLEAAVGRVPRHYRAYIGAWSAATYATDPPFPGLGSSSAAVAEYDVPPLRSRQFRIVARDWPPVDAAEWIGLTPRPNRVDGSFRLPAAALTRRLSDAAAPPPDTDTAGADVLRHVWSEPLVAWGATIDPGSARMMVLDAGTSGHFLLTRDGDDVVATGVSSRTVWNRMMMLIEAVLR